MDSKTIKKLLLNTSPPFQPELLQGKFISDVHWKVLEWNDVNIKNLACFYQFRTSETIGKINMYPDNCVKFLFECVPGSDVSKARFMGINTKKTELELMPGTKYFMFMPYSHLGLHLLASSAELQNVSMDIETVLSKNNALAICQNHINDKTSFNENIKVILENASNDVKDGYTVGISDYCSLAMCLSNGNINAENIERFTGYSSRHCRGKFKDSYGFGPKMYCRILRFQGAMDELIRQFDKDALDIVSDHGYFDQAHFIKDFKLFTDMCPNELKRAIGMGQRDNMAYKFRV